MKLRRIGRDHLNFMPHFVRKQKSALISCRLNSMSPCFHVLRYTMMVLEESGPFCHFYFLFICSLLSIAWWTIVSSSPSWKLSTGRVQNISSPCYLLEVWERDLESCFLPRPYWRAIMIWCSFLTQLQQVSTRFILVELDVLIIHCILSNSY